jgi:Cft2 family RNA processing exonuclease
MIMETTRGGRATPAGYSRDAEVERFAVALETALKRKAAVLIPTFALGRTQEILTLLALLMKAGRLKAQPIYIGGLGRVFTEIYDLQARRTHRQHGSLLLHDALNLVVLDQKQTREMKLGGGRIFVVTSGMMNEGTASHELAARMIGDERQTIFFVGYADPETPAGRLKASKPGETFMLSASAGEVTHRCQVMDFDLTAHAEREDLAEFVGQVSPRVVLLGHGDDAARAWFAQEIGRRYPKIKVLQPGPGEMVEA